VPESQIELGFPIGEVSSSSIAEKSVRHGHISTMQQWFARRPLAACRAAIFLALAPTDGQIEASPEARRILDEYCPDEGEAAKQLQAFAGRLSRWDSAADPDFIDAARTILSVGRERRPLVADTFAGGGSIPVEALRLGLDSFASDLHPTPMPALRAMIEHLPGRPDLVDRFEGIGAEIAEEIQDRVAPLYGESDGDPLAFFWARTYECSACGVTSPLFRDRWLARGRRTVVAEVTYKDDRPVAEVLELDDTQAVAAGEGNLTGRGARCLSCGALTSTADLRAQGVDGRLGEWLYAKLVKDAGGEKRYVAASAHDRALALAAVPQWKNGGRVPTTPLDPNGVRHTWAMQYGLRTVADLHTPRQARALDEIMGAVIAARDRHADEDTAALTSLLCLAFNRLLPYSTRHTWWQSTGQFPANMYSRQAIPMVWDFAEIPLSSPGAAGWTSSMRWVSTAARRMAELPRAGRVARADAGSTPLDDDTVDLVAIDPPYFDSVGYSYLAQPFVAWSHALLEPVLGEQAAPDDFAAHEAIVDRKHSLAPSPKDRAHFTIKMSEAFAEAARVLRPDGLLLVMYGHREIVAWESVLEAAAHSGFVMTSSWPLHTERKAKFRHGHINALAGSCLLTFRNTGAGLPTVDYDALLDSLEAELAEKQPEYVAHGVDGVDLNAALTVLSMGSFMARRVMRSDGTEVELADFVEDIPTLLARTQLRLARRDPSTPEAASLARRYLAVAQEEHWEEFDALVLSEVDSGDHGGALNLIRYASLSDSAGSDGTRTAAIVLGRLSVQATARQADGGRRSDGEPGFEVRKAPGPDARGRESLDQVPS
jgi:putative DNA methylase